MRKIIVSLLIIIAYIWIVVFFPNFQYIFPAINLEIIKFIIAGSLLGILCLSKRLHFSQLKIQKSIVLWLKYPVIFAALFFASIFVLHLIFLGSEYLRFPTANQITDLILVLCGTVIFEEVISRAFLTNLLLQTWKQKTNAAKGILLFSGILFGALHYFNYREFSVVSIVHSLSASFIGIYFCMTFCRTNSISSTIVLHTIINFPAFLLALMFDTNTLSESAGEKISLIMMFILLVLSIPFLIITIKHMRAIDTASP